MKIDERGDKLARQHFNYIGELLRTRRIDGETLNVIRFHYISAFTHGYKYGRKEK